MKRSSCVALVLSGAILGGCSRQPASPEWGDRSTGNDNEQVLTNNTYIPGRGYYHAPYSRFFPFPYNYYAPGNGYYHGGRYTPEPNPSPVIASKPSDLRARTASSGNVDRGGFTRSGSSTRSSAS